MLLKVDDALPDDPDCPLGIVELPCAIPAAAALATFSVIESTSDYSMLIL
jgi:hypothetical protein